MEKIRLNKPVPPEVDRPPIVIEERSDKSKLEHK